MIEAVEASRGVGLSTRVWDTSIGAALHNVLNWHSALLQRITAPVLSYAPPCRDKLSPVLLHSYIGIFHNSLEFDRLDVVLDVSSRSSATRQGWSRGNGVCDDFMKPCLSSSGCETRPAKGEPARPVASLAPETVTDSAKRRHASEWAVDHAATKGICFRVPKVLDHLKATATAPRDGRGAVRTRRGR